MVRLFAMFALMLGCWVAAAQTSFSKPNITPNASNATSLPGERKVLGELYDHNVVHYTTTNANVKYVFATAEPLLHLKPGEILDTNTLDCFGNGLKKPGDTLSMAKGDNPLAGPFYVEGAEPGDTLVVKILDLQVDGDTGIGAFAPGFGAINETNYTDAA